jgi:molecular chaperone GrpE
MKENNSSNKNNRKEEKNQEARNSPPAEEIKEAESSGVKNEAKISREEYDDLRNKYLRLGADFENVRKRWEREKEEIIKFAESSLLRDILVIMDELERALKIAKEHTDAEKITQGIEMTYNNFGGILKKRGVKTIEAKGKKFDPHLYEIAASVETEDENEHIVIDEIQKGYFLEDKVLRTAKVIVGVKKRVSPTEEIAPGETNNGEGLGEA